MIKDIAIFGAGGLGREVGCLIRLINEQSLQWNLVGYFEDEKPKGYLNEYGEVLGGMEELNNYDRPLAVAIAIGNPKAVFTLRSKINNNNIYYPNLIAPDTVFLDKSNLSFGTGNIIAVGCSFSCAVKIGNFNIFNGHINVGHDTQIGDFNAFMPAVKISGEVTIGECNFFGVNSVVLQKIEIGTNTIVGAGSIVIRNTKDNRTYIGIPAKTIKY